MSLKDNTVNGVLWSGIDTFGQYFIQFVVTILLARLLTPADFGLIEMLVIFSALSNVLLDSGFGQALIRKKDASNIDYTSVFFFNVFCALLLYAFLYFAAPLIARFYSSPELTSISRIFFIVIILNAFVIIQNTILSKALNFRVLAKVSLIASLFSGVVGIALAIADYGVWALVFQMLCHSLVKVVLLWTFSSWKPAFIFSGNAVKGLWSFSSKLMVNGLLDVLFTNLQSLVIGKYFTKTELGLYSQAKRLQSVPSQTLTHMIQKVTYPALAKIQNDNYKLKVAYRKIIQITTFVVFTVMLYLIAVADNLFYVVLSEKWMPAVEYFRPLCIIGVLHPMQSVNINIFLVKGRSGYMLKLSMIRRVMVVISLLLAIEFGILVLVWSLVLTYVATGIIFIYFGGRLINYSIIHQMKDVAPTLFISLAVSYLSYILGEYFIKSTEFIKLSLQSIFFYLLFFLACHLLNIEPYKEIKIIIKGLLQKYKVFKS